VNPLALLLLVAGGFALGSWAGSEPAAPPAPGPKPGPKLPPPRPTGPVQKPNAPPRTSPWPAGGTPEPPPIDPVLGAIDPVFASYVYALSSADPQSVRATTWFVLLDPSVPRTAGLDAWILELESMQEPDIAAYAQIVEQAWTVVREPQGGVLAAANMLHQAAEAFRAKGLGMAGANLDALAAVMALFLPGVTAEVQEAARLRVRGLAEQGIVPLEALADLGYEIFRELWQWNQRWDLITVRTHQYQPGILEPPSLADDLPEATYAAPPYYFAREWRRHWGEKWNIGEERWNW
jgi:hypothetical protein